MGSLNIPIITQHLEGVVTLFSDVVYLEQQILLIGDEEIQGSYHKVLIESIKLVESLYISDERGGLSLVDKKFSEYITFRSQDALHDALDIFWGHVESKKIQIHDMEAIRRSMLDTFFPVAVVYIHIFEYQKIIIKKILKIYNSLSYEIMTGQGMSNRDEILSYIKYSKKYSRKMLRKNR